MDLGLSGRVALVTAASRGLGLASAKALAADGVSLLICARGPLRLDEAAREIRSATSGAQVETMTLDVSAPDAATQLVKQARDHYGRLDVLVNNAGGPPPGTFTSVGDADWEKAFQITLMSVVRLVREALPLLKNSGQGRIINIVSTSVKQPIDGLILSNALRSAVVGMAKTLSKEVGPFGVTVNNVLPGQVFALQLTLARGLDPDTPRGLNKVTRTL